MQRALILGGARSGKSAYGEQMALALSQQGAHPVRYVATAQAGDDEMRQRIAHHRDARAAFGWETVEEPLQLAPLLAKPGNAQGVILLDCLTLWLSNVILTGQDTTSASDILLEAIASCTAKLIIISNEVGLGIVPDNALARQFRDAAGRLNQRVASACDHVVFMAAGLPMRLK